MSLARSSVTLCDVSCQSSCRLARVREPIEKRHKIDNVHAVLPKSAQHGAKEPLAEITGAANRSEAEKAVKAFAANSSAKWPKATAKTTDDLDVLSLRTHSPW